MPALSK